MSGFPGNRKRITGNFVISLRVRFWILESVAGYMLQVSEPVFLLSLQLVTGNPVFCISRRPVTGNW
jgi:hypothetical protein